MGTGGWADVTADEAGVVGYTARQTVTMEHRVDVGRFVRLVNVTPFLDTRKAAIVSWLAPWDGSSTRCIAFSDGLADATSGTGFAVIEVRRPYPGRAPAC